MPPRSSFLTLLSSDRNAQIDTDDILAGCKCTNECLCIEEKCCVAANETPHPIGLVKDDKFLLKLGLPCCTCGIKVLGGPCPRLT
jgi:hypothetical protein